MPAVVIAESGPVSFRVRASTPSGCFEWRHHKNQLLQGTAGLDENVEQDYGFSMWPPAVVIAQSGPASFRVRASTPSGCFEWRHHKNQLLQGMAGLAENAEQDYGFSMWPPAVVIAQSGPASFRVRASTPSGCFEWRHHKNQLLQGTAGLAENAEQDYGFSMWPQSDTEPKSAPSLLTASVSPSPPT
ncbi:hypothetical protein MTO96_003242 [Rhipicephalus appendiculatus]